MNEHLLEALRFFIIDSIKILFLLFAMIFVVGVLRTYINQKKLKKLTRGKYGVGNLFASLFGTITPFCSCSSIPLFWGFLEAGIPLGTSLSFLITSPLVNEFVVVLMLATFGWKITLAYVISGVLIGTLAGIILGKMKLEKYLVKDMIKQDKEKKYYTFKERFHFGLHEAVDIIKKLWLWVLAGVALGAIIHNLVPQDFFVSLVGRGGLWTVPLAIIVGVPLYGSAAALVPVAEALFAKGIPLGTTLAFIMSIAALSFPEAVILRRAMKLKLIGIFFGVVAIGILITGILFNVLF